AWFEESIPRQFQEDTLRCLFDSWWTAHEECRARFPESEHHDLVGHYRRALFEAQWRDVADDFKPEMEAVAEPNQIGSYFHTVITCGRIKITASAVDKPERIVRPADFRDTLAEDNQKFFSFMPRHKVPKDGWLYALLLYGPGDHKYPGFADIVFPG